MKNVNMESTNNEKPNVLAIIYVLGLISFTAYNYTPSDGVWVALGKAIIWPLALLLSLLDRFL